MAKKDRLISQDDQYAHTWDTNFGTSPFDVELKNCDQQEETVEYEPTSQPEIYRPPAHNNFEEVRKIPKISFLKILQKHPKTTQKIMHKKQKKLLKQEVKSTTHVQTLNLTTQTHTHTKKIKRLKDFN